MKHKQHGFSALWLGVLVAISAMVGVAGWRVYQIRSGMLTDDTSEAAILTGTVTEGPTAPVCRADAPCERAVSNHIIEALDVSGRVAATGKTNDIGQYSLHLHPGHYALVLVPQIGLNPVAKYQVDVKGGTTTYDLSVDTGLR